MNMHNSAIEPPDTGQGDTPAPLPGILVADYFSQGPGYYSRRRHGVADWLLTYTVAGRGRYTLAGREIYVEPGDVALLQPGAPHDYRTDPESERWDFYWAHFLPRPAWSEWLLWDEPVAGPTSGACGGFCRACTHHAGFSTGCSKGRAASMRGASGSRRTRSKRRSC